MQHRQSRLSPLPCPNGKSQVIEVIYPGPAYKYYKQSYKKYYASEEKMLQPLQFAQQINDGKGITVGNITYAKKAYPQTKI